MMATLNLYSPLIVAIATVVLVLVTVVYVGVTMALHREARRTRLLSSHPMLQYLAKNPMMATVTPSSTDFVVKNVGTGPGLECFALIDFYCNDKKEFSTHKNIGILAVGETMKHGVTIYSGTDYHNFHKNIIEALISEEKLKTISLVITVACHNAYGVQILDKYDYYWHISEVGHPNKPEQRGEWELSEALHNVVLNDSLMKISISKIREYWRHLFGSK